MKHAVLRFVIFVFVCVPQVCGETQAAYERFESKGTFKTLFGVLFVLFVLLC